MKSEVHEVMLTAIVLCRDSGDAVYERDGYDYDGYRLRVEFPRGGRGGGGRGMGPPRTRYGPPSRRSDYRVVVSGGQCFLHCLPLNVNSVWMNA